jgi:hypothetical protein
MVLVGAGGVLYAFGTPQAPQPMQAAPAGQQAPQAATVAAGEATGDTPAEQTAGTADGEVPPPDPSVPLAIEIPGCVCHSDDPEIVEEHATYRMNQCAGCHAGAVPTGQ